MKGNSLLLYNTRFCQPVDVCIMSSEEYFVSARDLENDCIVKGFLDKKRPSKKLLSVKYQRRWCVLHETTLYYFDNPQDRRQKGAFSLIGYKFWVGECAYSFSLVGSGKRTYDFICPTKEDFEKWKDSITSITETIPSGHEVFVNRSKSHSHPEVKSTVSSTLNHSRSSPSLPIRQQSSRKKTPPAKKLPLSRENSSESSDGSSQPKQPPRPPPLSRTPPRPPPPGKRDLPKITPLEADIYARVDKTSHLLTSTTHTQDDLEDYDLPDMIEERSPSITSEDSNEDPYDRPDVIIREHLNTPDSDSDWSDPGSLYTRPGDIKPRNSEDYSKPSELLSLKRASDGYDKPEEVDDLRKLKSLPKQDEDPSYLSSSEINTSGALHLKTNHSSADRNRKLKKKSSSFNVDNETCYLDLTELGSGPESSSKQTDSVSSNIGKLLNIKSANAGQMRGMQGIPEDDYMEFIGEESDDISFKANDPEEVYLEFIGEDHNPEEHYVEEDDGHEEKVTRDEYGPDDVYMEFIADSDTEFSNDMSRQNGNKNKQDQNRNTPVRSTQSSHAATIASINSELRTKLQFNSKSEQDLMGSNDSDQSSSDDDECDYENVSNLSAVVKSRSIPRGMKLSGASKLPLNKRKQSSFESDKHSSSEDDYNTIVDCV